jgi:subtilisin family serine protease
VGLYQFAVIAQGDDSSCSADVIEVMVTANPEKSDNLEVVGTPDSSLFKHLDQIHARQAWAQSRGRDSIVAVVDTGVNYNHPSLRDRIVIKTAEQEAADGNDFNGDTMGWDFVNGDNRPFDDEGHGSHVSGLVASSFAGVAPDAKILPVKVMDAAGTGDLASVIAGILYAVNNGAQIINLSLGFDLPFAPIPMVSALRVARDKGVLVFVAAGNGDPMTGLGYDIGVRPSQPASVRLENMMTIAATGEGVLTSYSNFSAKLVDMAAPGGDDNEPVVSLSTLNPENIELNEEVGTSMATPVVSGVAALLLSANPSLTPAQAIAILKETGDELPSLAGKTVTGKQVNAQAAVQKALDLNPAQQMN